MGRTACPACGANVDIAQEITTGERVPLEINTDASTDAPRYRIANIGPPLQCERVPDEAAGDFHPDHRWDCPAHNAGRTF